MIEVSLDKPLRLVWAIAKGNKDIKPYFRLAI